MQTFFCAQNKSLCDHAEISATSSYLVFFAAPGISATKAVDYIVCCRLQVIIAGGFGIGAGRHRTRCMVCTTICMHYTPWIRKCDNFGEWGSILIVLLLRQFRKEVRKKLELNHAASVTSPEICCGIVL